MSEPPQPPPPPQYGAYPGSYPPPPPQYGGYPGGYPPPAATAPKNGLGVASLVVAIIALFSVVGGIVLGIVAIILGFLGRGRAKRGEANNGGIAIAGIVLGALSIIVSIAVIAIAVWGFKEVGGTDYFDCVTSAGSDQVAVQECTDEFTQRVEDQLSITPTR
ncbi:hypothetical protein NGTWS0302_06090 [Mycolicibacterium cyprinidarum]|uniref:DUF4190 domain-containing protein n=1 Tax=Mycolicibacterium cyprinidarum TaxID=2860311 RepID=A0ABQ4VE89_9MYCO|nr:hypothetical protein NGTWS0302_06090 [Mycolicibacterium sp. NGTWS0302]GJF14599.1 hypothetical protein NGTWS1702_16710 [Mycolicibacterium sp. NGTWSNA01]